MMQHFPSQLSMVRFSKKEMDDVTAMIERLDFKCGDYGWVPTLRDVEDKIIGSYQEKVREKLRLASEMPADSRARMQEIEDELKQLWIFMYWIVDTCPDMDPVAYNKLCEFIKEKHEVR